MAEEIRWQEGTQVHRPGNHPHSYRHAPSQLGESGEGERSHPCLQPTGAGPGMEFLLSAVLGLPVHKEAAPLGCECVAHTI